MHTLTYEKRLAAWVKFRESLETSIDPLQDVINFYSTIPVTTMNCDPWDRDTWLNPWELLHENEYCEYCILLGMCYTLQLTDRFSTDEFEIHIGIDEQKTRHYYLLVVGDRVLGYDNTTHVHVDEAFKSVQSQTKYQITNNQ